MGRMTHQGMLTCALHWELLQIHWPRGSTREILNNQPKAVIPLLDSKISEISPTHISPPLWLWQPPRKDCCPCLTTSHQWAPLCVHANGCFHSSFASCFRLLNTQNLQLALVGDSYWVLRTVENKSPHLAPKYGFRRLTLASDFF